jgi:hypothetical protein
MRKVKGKTWKSKEKHVREERKGARPLEDLARSYKLETLKLRAGLLFLGETDKVPA